MITRAAALWSLGVLALLVAAALAVSVVVSRPLFDETLEPSLLDTIRIAPADQALTFARAPDAAGPRVILVTRYERGRVTGIDLDRALGARQPDPIALFRQLGYDALAQVARYTDPVTVAAAQLGLPFDPLDHNVAVGLNYREHAEESRLQEPPFLFPKLAAPTPWHGDLARAGSVLLDYEAELGFVALDDIAGAEPPPATMGLVLANEVTDRWTLVRDFERDAPMGTTGFADGKSRDGFAPLGPLLVVPRDLESFYRAIELRLYVNGRLRQRESASAMLWAPRQILAEAFGRAATPFRYRGGAVSLLPGNGRLPAGTIVFSGTPAGVIFKPLNLWNPWVYLRPGDEVVVRADYLGVIRNRITP